MTEQDINIKIAEYMGINTETIPYITEYGITSFVDTDTCFPMPDYCNDLNAVWKVEEKLDNDRLWDNYSQALWVILKLKIGLEKRYVNIIDLQYETYVTAHLTAKQKCEAIVKVLDFCRV